ncbi:hypothetical protein RYH80_17780 [Halobaculum sp. MBLA0147]|uniref:hypothetical protein n=1 Tax=Halobaculum sp. MBLA0147 TaxID=3079934 RepID=UPI003524293D
MEQPTEADGWPDRPLTETEATALLDPEVASGVEIDPSELRTTGGDAVAVWVMDHESAVRARSVPADAPDDAVIDLVVETEVAFEMFSYTGGRWVDYGTQYKDDEDAPDMAGTLDSYRVLAGGSDAV